MLASPPSDRRDPTGIFGVKVGGGNAEGAASSDRWAGVLQSFAPSVLFARTYPAAGTCFGHKKNVRMPCFWHVKQRGRLCILSAGDVHQNRGERLGG